MYLRTLKISKILLRYITTSYILFLGIVKNTVYLQIWYIAYFVTRFG
jgi:hypothetical protein